MLNCKSNSYIIYLLTKVYHFKVPIDIDINCNLVYNMNMSYFVVFVLMLIFAVELSYLFKRGFGLMVAFSNLLLIFTLYIGGLFCDLYTTAMVFFTLIITLGILVTVKLIMRRDFKNIKNIVKNPSFFLYILLGIAFGIAFLRYTPLHTDEMTHWALVVKNMFAYHNFGNLGNSTTMFNRYVPATGLFMYAFQVFNAEFNSGALFASFDLLLVSLLLPVFELFKGKYSVSSIVCAMIAMLLPMIFKSNIYSNLLVDAILGVMTGYIYLVYRIDKGKADILTILNISLGCFVVTMTKSSGVALAIFAMIFIVIDAFTLGKQNVKEFFKKKINFVIIVLPIIFIVFAKLSWSWYVDYYNVRAGWDASEMTLANIIKWIKEPTEYQSQVTKLFFKTFFLGEFSGNILQVPYIFIFAITTVMCVFFGLSTKNKKFAITQGIVTVVLSVGYGVFLLLLYLFSFAYWEGLSLASYGRYNTTNLLAMAMIYYYLSADLFADRIVSKTIENRKFFPKLQRILAPLTLAVYCLIAVGVSVGGFYKFGNEADRFKAMYKEWSTTVETLGKDDSVYIVIKDDEKWDQAFEYIHMRFIASPMQTSGYLEGGSYTEGREAEVCYTGNPFSMELTVDEFVQSIKTYTHVYIDDLWTEFENKYGALFESGIEEKALYKVVPSENGVRLVSV